MREVNSCLAVNGGVREAKRLNLKAKNMKEFPN
jgi:hypothetical protein